MIIGEIVLAAACLLLVVAGGSKIVDPVPAALLLGDVGVRVGRAAGRTIGMAEAVAGATGLVVTNGWVVGGVGILYLGFAIVLAVAIRHGSDRSCGCFGTGGAPPRYGHVAINGVLASTVGVAAVAGVPSAWDATVVRGPWFPVVAVVAAVAVAGLIRVGDCRPS